MAFSSLDDLKNFGRVPVSLIEDRSAKCLQFLEAANGEMLDYFRAAPGIDLPLPESSVTSKMRQVECWIAAWSLACDIGFDPTSKSDEVYRLSYDDAIAWLTKVAAGKIQPIPLNADGNIDDADPESDNLTVEIYSETKRGWS